MIQLKNFSLYVDKRVLIENINYSFNYGKVIGIYGKSGKGKTTFFKALVGLYNDYKGNIIYDNKNDISKTFYKNNIFYCSTENKLFENNTVMENIKILSNDCKKIDYYVKKFNLNKILKQKIKYCSLGEQQRVLLCICFINNKRINLLDETLCNLDYKTLSLVKEEIKIKSNNSLFIIISHSIKDIEDICDEIIDFDNFNNINTLNKEENINWENSKNKANYMLIKNDFKIFKKILLSIFSILLFLISALILNMIQPFESYVKEIIKSDKSICFISSKNMEEINYYYIESNNNDIFNLIVLDELYLNNNHVTLNDDEVILSKSLYLNNSTTIYSSMDYKLNVKDIFYEDENLDYKIVDSIDYSIYKSALIVNKKTFYNIFYANYGLFLTKDNLLVKLDHSLNNNQCIIESKVDNSYLTKIEISTCNLSLDVINTNQVEKIRKYDNTYPNSIIYVSNDNFELIKNNIEFNIESLFNKIKTAYVFSTSNNVELVYNELINNNDNIQFTLRKKYDKHKDILVKNQITIYITFIISIISSLSVYIYLKYYQKIIIKKIDKTMDNYFIKNIKKSIYKIIHTNFYNIFNIILSVVTFIIIHNKLIYEQIYFYNLKLYAFYPYIILFIIEVIDILKCFKLNSNRSK